MRTKCSLILIMAVGVASAQTLGIGQMVNGASYQAANSISPGEIMVFFGGGYGGNLGPDTLALGQSGNQFLTNVGGTQVLFGGIAAPVLYSSANQVSAIVPYEVAGKASVDVQIQYQDVVFDGGSVPVAATALALFSANSSGTGAGAILNQDYTLNSPTHPAAPGDVVMLYGTGEGISNPPPTDGQIDNSGVLHRAVASVTATFSSGLSGNVLYEGGAPGLVPGLMQMNVQVPPELTACTEERIPVVISSGSQSSQAGITLQIQTPASVCNRLPIPFTSGYMFPAIAYDDASGFGGSYTLQVAANGDGTYYAALQGDNLSAITFLNGVVKGSTMIFSQIDNVNEEPELLANTGDFVAFEYGTLSLNLTLPMQPTESVSGSMTFKGVDLSTGVWMTIQANIPATTFISGS